MDDETRKNRLFQAVETSYRKLEPFRTMQQALVDEYAGDGYGAGGKSSKREIIVNLLNQTVDAYMMVLAANRPRVLVSTHKPALKPFAAHYQVALNNLMQEIGIEYTIRRWVLDAFFCIGIVKVHMANSGLVQIEKDLWADPGKPFASNVSLDNFVYDTSATKWTEVQFAGDCYRIPFDDLQDSTIYDQDVVKDIRPSSKTEWETERLENIGRGYEVDQDEFLPMVDLIDLWLPRDGVIETYPCKFTAGKLTPYGEPAARMEWDGSEFGNYHVFGFGDVPENIMPTSPASQLAALARHINNIYRKQIRSARDFKEIDTYPPGGEKDGRSVQNAKHGDLVCVNDPRELGKIRTGGVSQELQMFLLNMQNDFNSAAGNLSAMLGLGAQADTLGQEKLIHGAVGGKTASMAERVRDAVTSLARDLGHMVWRDEVNVIPGQIELEGLDGYAVDATWRPNDREGDFIDYNLSIDVYSMAYKSPAERANAILQVLSQVYGPFMQMLMSQGGTINFQRLNETLAELMDMPRLKDIVQFAGDIPEQPGAAPPGGGGSPSSTSREYIRRSVGAGGTPQSRNVMQQQAWANTATPQQQGMLARAPS